MSGVGDCVTKMVLSNHSVHGITNSTNIVEMPTQGKAVGDGEDKMTSVWPHYAREPDAPCQVP